MRAEVDEHAACENEDGVDVDSEHGVFRAVLRCGLIHYQVGQCKGERADEERNSISEEDLIEGWACLPVTSHAFMSPTPGDVDHDSCGDSKTYKHHNIEIC